MSAAREFAAALIRRHDKASLEAAWFLLTPPFAVAVFSVVVAAGLGWLGGSPVVVTVFAAATLSLAAVLAVALVQARASSRTWLALGVAPWYVPWKAVVQVRAFMSVSRADETYAPTPR